MAKKKKQLEYVYAANPDELNLRFYTRYDENFLFNKALALAVVLEDDEHFKAQVAELQNLDASRITDKFFESLRAEIHFTEMHQFEGFFALLIAIFQDLPHWLYLTDYTTKQIKDAIELYIRGDIKTVTNNRATNKREFITNAVYATYQPDEESRQDTWNINLDNIDWLIRHMAERYIAASEYNAYKHGLRVMTGQSWFGMRLENPPGNPVGPLRVVASSEDSLSYLEAKEKVIQLPPDNQTSEDSDTEQSRAAEQGEEVTVLRVYEITKHFNPQESIAYLSIMNRLLATIKCTRLAFYDDGKGLQEALANFSDLDKDQLLALGVSSHFTSSFSI